MAEAQVLLQIDAGIAHIILNDPARLNAVTMTMAELALAAFEKAEAEARVVVFTGSGRAFCSGGNMASGTGAGAEDIDPGGPLISHFNPLIRKIRNLAIPLISAVRGVAAGYGASLALAGDLIVASENAYFLQAFRNVGLVPDGGSALLLTRAVGRVRAAELMLLGEKLPAAKALQWGLISRVVADDQLETAVHSLAENLAAGPTIALGKMRQMAWAASEGSFDDELELEVCNQRIAGATADHREGVAAFLAKRPPNFTGR